MSVKSPSEDNPSPPPASRQPPSTPLLLLLLPRRPGDFRDHSDPDPDPGVFQGQRSDAAPVISWFV